MQTHFRHGFYQFTRQLVGFAAGGAVADGNQLHAVFFNQTGKCGQHIVFLVQIHNHGIQQLARVAHHRAFHAVAVAGVEPERGQAAGGGSEQQVFEIAGEHGNGIGVGVFFQTA